MSTSSPQDSTASASGAMVIGRDTAYPSGGLAAVASGDKMTVMAVPHFEQDYDETLAEHMTAELGVEVAQGVLGSGSLSIDSRPASSKPPAQHAINVNTSSANSRVRQPPSTSMRLASDRSIKRPNGRRRRCASNKPMMSYTHNEPSSRNARPPLKRSSRHVKKIETTASRARHERPRCSSKSISTDPWTSRTR